MTESKWYSKNDARIKRLSHDKNLYHLNESSLDSSMTDLFPFTRESPSNSDTLQFTRTPKQTSMIDFSHYPEVNIENNFGELIPVKFRNLIFTELENDINVLVQNQIKEHLKNETPKLDQTVTESYLKEINISKKELNKKEALIKELIEIIRNVTTNSL